MPYGVKRMLEIEAERQKRREEKARLKAEKEKKKKLEKRRERMLKMRRRRYRINKAKEVKEREAYHKSIGDEKGRFTIYLMRNGKRLVNNTYGQNRYKVSALKRFHKLVEENHKTVQYPKTFSSTNNKICEVKYELVLVQKIDEKDNNITLIRDENGKFLENYFTDTQDYKIIEKSDWYVEETFAVYGFNPLTERKDFNYIFNNIVLKNSDVYTRFIVISRFVIHHYDDDLDIIMCKNKQQAIDLYDKIEKVLDKKKYPNIFFMGRVKGQRCSWLIDDMQKKTGWERKKCYQSRVEH